MTNRNRKNVLVVCLVTIFSFLTLSCEPDADALGEQFFVENALEGVKKNYDIVAYNKNNEDFIQADSKTLNVARLGAFNESVFGMQKASYISQLNLMQYDPDFGNNAVLDSAVMYLISPYDSKKPTEKSIDFDYPDGKGGVIASTQEMTSYPVVKYGNERVNGTDAIFNINVHEVTDFLKSTSDTVYSNASINYGNLIGTKEFKGSINKVRYVNKQDNTVLFEASESLRIPLDVNFFQSKIINQQGSDNLKDLASFIRYFKGVRLSVEENDGYLFALNPNKATIVLYYNYDNDSGVNVKSKFILNMGVGNTHIGQYEYDRTNSILGNKINTINTQDGDSKLFLQGMGGPSVMLKIPAAVIADLRDKFNNDKIGIIGARIRLYTDESTWNNDYAKPNDFVFLGENATAFLPESIYQLAIPNFRLITPYKLDEPTSYYDLSVTKTLKKAIEESTTNNDIILKLDVGTFINGTNGKPINYKSTTRAYAPERLVLVGSEPNNEKRVQLQITYAK